MSRISGFKNKIKKLEEINSNLERSNIRCKAYVFRYKKELNELRNIVKTQDIKIDELVNRDSLKYLLAKEREIIELKQEGQCKQIILDSLEWQLDRTEKNLKNAGEVIYRLNTNIKNLEDKKIKNRLKKLLAG